MEMNNEITISMDSFIDGKILTLTGKKQSETTFISMGK